MPDTRRLFFALWPDKMARSRLDAIARQYRPEHARAIPKTNLHATLIFLGPMTEQRLPGIRRAAGQVQVQGFTLVLQQLQVWRKPQVLCLCPEKVPGALEQMHDDLASSLLGHEIGFDQRKFRPHVTLARKVRKPLHIKTVEKPFEWKVGGFSLVESVSTDRGVRYDVLDRW